MRRIIITFVILIAAVSSVPVGTAAVQEPTDSTTTIAPSTTPETTQATELSLTMRIKPWLFLNGTSSLVVEAGIPARIAITDAGELSRIPSEGDGVAAERARIRCMILTPGTTVVKFRVESVGDASAIIVSSSNADDIVAIRSDAAKTGNPPVEYGTVQTLLAPTAVAAVGRILLWVRKKCNEKQLEVERERRTTG